MSSRLEPLASQGDHAAAPAPKHAQTANTASAHLQCLPQVGVHLRQHRNLVVAVDERLALGAQPRDLRVVGAHAHQRLQAARVRGAQGAACWSVPFLGGWRTQVGPGPWAAATRQESGRCLIQQARSPPLPHLVRTHQLVQPQLGGLHLGGHRRSQLRLVGLQGRHGGWVLAGPVSSGDWLRCVWCWAAACHTRSIRTGCLAQKPGPF